MAKAREALREQPGSSWVAHRARINTDPLNYPNPFGPDPEAIRLRTLVWCHRLLVQLTGRGGNTPISRSNANTVLRTLRLMRDLADDLDGAEASNHNPALRRPRRPNGPADRPRRSPTSPLGMSTTPVGDQS